MRSIAAIRLLPALVVSARRPQIAFKAARSVSSASVGPRSFASPAFSSTRPLRIRIMTSNATAVVEAPTLADNPLITVSAHESRRRSALVGWEEAPGGRAGGSSSACRWAHVLPCPFAELAIPCL